MRKLVRWQKYMENYCLPTWEELPDMELYMDQVVSLVNRYLDLIPHDADNSVLTASTVNNYVRLRVMPPPERKRYGRRHLAYLIMICLMKQSLTLSEIQKVLLPDLPEEDIRQTYNEFVGRMTTTTEHFIDQVNAIATASEEQSSASQEINQSLILVSDRAKETAIVMAEAAKAVEELAGQAQGLTRLIQELKQS